MLKLRDYQKKAVDNVFREWETTRSTLVVSPTGTGKTVLMCEIVKRAFPKRVMILAHRMELIFQARDKVRRFTGLEADVEMADLFANEHASLFGKPPVVVSSIQTQNAGGEGRGRMGRFDPWEFGIVIVDEAHHATAPSYRRVLNYYLQNENIRMLGVTATPDRADEEALGQIYDTVAFDYEIIDAVNEGYLVPIQQRMIEVGSLDYSNIRTTAGDLNGADLAQVMEEEQNLHAIASPAIEICGDRRALVFASGQGHGERLTEIFQRHGKTAGWICDKTPKDTRIQLLEDYAAGKIQYMVNVGCLTEGFDDAGIEVVVIGRPTKSRSLYAQMVGRGTRPLTGLIDGLETANERKSAIAASRKPHLEVLDFVGNSGRHKLVTCADILGGKVSDEIVELAAKKARESGGPVDMSEAIIEAQREAEERKRLEAAKRARLRARAEWSAKTIDPFALWDIQPTRERGWERGKTLSEKQRELLLKQGVDPDERSYHECKQILDELFRRWDAGLCSLKQSKHLKRYGLPTDLTRTQASMVLDGIWKEKKTPDMAYNEAVRELQEVANEVPF